MSWLPIGALAGTIWLPRRVGFSPCQPYGVAMGCGAAGELSRLVALGGDAGRALVLGGDAESIGVGFSGWQVEAKRARRGCLTAPSTIPDGDLIGVRLSRDVLGQPPRPGRCLLHTGDGKLITVSVPAL
jgi:DNA segregation ATPase FtsK/SpoIIIE, S-DNA-T family